MLVVQENEVDRASREENDTGGDEEEDDMRNDFGGE